MTGTLCKQHDLCTVQALAVEEQHSGEQGVQGRTGLTGMPMETCCTMGMNVSCIIPSSPFCRQLCTVPALQTNTAPPRLPPSILCSQLLSVEHRSS